MRVRLYTQDGDLGTAELAPGRTVQDLVAALRRGQFYVDRIIEEEPAEPAPKRSKETAKA